MINDTLKFLGFTIDNKLNFEEHINALATKISKSQGVLCSLCHILPKSALRNLYYSMIQPHLLYKITLWESAFDKQKDLQAYKIKLLN